MDILGLARVGLGLLGVLAAVQGLVAFPGLAGTATVIANEHGTPAAVFSVLLPFSLVWLVSYYLVFRNLTLARLLSVPSRALPHAESPAPSRIVVGLAGILIFAYALPGVTTSLGAIVAQGSLALGRGFWNITVAYVAQAGLGVALLLRPQLFLQFWSRRESEVGAV